MRSSSSARKAGFTLIEVAIVLAILGLIIAYLLPPFGKQVSRAKTKSVDQTVAQVRDEIINLGLMNASCILPPPGPDNTVPEGVTNRLDPWGNPLYYFVDTRLTNSTGVCHVCGTDINATRDGNDMTDIAFIVGSRGKNAARDVLLDGDGSYLILDQGEKVTGTGRVFDDAVATVSLTYLATKRSRHNGPLDCDGAELCLPFAENARDASGNGHDGTVTGAVLQHDRFGCLNGTYGFDGNDFLSCGNDSSLNAGYGDISLAAWVRVTGRQPNSWQPATTGGYFGAIAGKGFLANRTGFGMYTRSASASRDNYCFEFQVRQINTVTAVRSGNQVSQYGIPDQWRFVVGVLDRDRPNGLRVYIDGQLMNSTDPLTLEGSNLTDSVQFTAGCRDAGSMGFYFNGQIDDVRLYKRALGAQEILTMYQNERP